MRFLAKVTPCFSGVHEASAPSDVGVNKTREGAIGEAIGCFAGGAGALVAIKVGEKLAPKLNALLDWGIDCTETALLEGVATVRSDFTRTFLRQQAQLNEEVITEGYNPDRTAIPRKGRYLCP